MSDVGTSKNIATYEAGEYIVTAALWVNVLGYDTYEIGIRDDKRTTTNHRGLLS